MTIDFATYCCSKDADKLQENFKDHLFSHDYNFDNVHIIFQRCEMKFSGYESCQVHQIRKEDYPDILLRNNISPYNEEADEYTHGWDGPHYWKHHCVNHLVALEASNADYIVLSDADCHIKSQPDSWVTKGIKILQSNKNVLVVSPSDGGDKKDRFTQNMSQQLFLCDRERLRGIDFDLEFEGFKEGGPMQEYYFMLEGRIGRYMEKNNLQRYILGNQYRYWHKQWH